MKITITTEKKEPDAGRMRQEGKDYIVQDGDVGYSALMYKNKEEQRLKKRTKKTIVEEQKKNKNCINN